MKKPWKIVLIFLIISAGAGIAAMEYANKVLIPVKIKGWTQKSLSNALGRTVEIRRLSLHLWRGVILEGVSVSEDGRFGREPFLQVERISGRPLYLPLLRSRQVIIPSIRVTEPKIRLVQNQEKQWNFQSLMPARSGKSAKPGPLKVLVPRVLFEKGRLELNMDGTGQPLQVVFDPLDAQIQTALPTGIEWSVDTRFESQPQSHLRIKGRYDLKTAGLSLSLDSVADSGFLLGLVPKGTIQRVEEIGGSIALQLQATGPKKGPFSMQGILETRGLRLKVPLSSPIVWRDRTISSLEETGDLRIDMDGTFPPPAQTPPWKAWRGRIGLNGISLKPLPLVEELRGLSGLIHLSAEGIKTENLKGRLPSGSAVELTGSIRHDADRMSLFTCATRFDLKEIAAFLPDQEKLLERIQPDGPVELELTTEGPLLPQPALQLSVKGAVKGATVRIPQVGPLTQIKGQILYRNNKVILSGGQGLYKGIPFLLSGSMEDLRNPTIEAHLEWDRLELDSIVSIDESRIRIDRFNGRLGEGLFNVLGVISKEKEPAATLYGEISADAAELIALLPSPPARLTDGKVKGPVEARWMLEGPLKKPQRCGYQIQTRSPSLMFDKVPFQELTLDLKRQPGKQLEWDGKAVLAGGTLHTNGLMNPEGKGIPWSGRLEAHKVQLDTLADLLEWKERQLGGELSVQYQGSGTVSDLKNLAGEGDITIEGGRIAELPLLGGFADLFKMPTLKSIILQEAKGHFNVENGFLGTNNLELSSPQMTLNVRGQSGFLDGPRSPVEFRVIPTFAPELIPEETRSKIGKVLAKGTSYFVGEVQITGTWENPQRKFVSKPVTQILNEQIFNLQDILKDLF
ncbi:MAG: AsmA family protein [Candidatus Omnitrophica bacterium]|nr:AsmA family protein [Candidatus Omnitrophota bacterium]